MKKVLVGTIAAMLVVGAGCEEKAADPGKSLTDAAKSAGSAVKDAGAAVKDSAAKTVDATKDAAGKAADAAKDTAAKAADAAKDTAAKATDAAKDLATKAFDALGADVKKQVTDLSGSLGSFGGLLEGIKSKADATAKLPDIKTAIDKIGGAKGFVDKLSPEIKKTVGDYLAPVSKKVTDQIARLTADKDIGSVLGETLKGFKLW